jgi:hypothetical protein
MLAGDINLVPSLPEILWITEWGGMLVAVAGALVMSMNRGWSWYAWPLWILSNLLLIMPTAYSKHWGLVVMQVAFLAINVNGLLRGRRQSRRPPGCA